MFLKLLQLGFVFSLWMAFKAHSETLILQSSDQHSSYKKMESFLASIEVLSRRFKLKHPNGSVVLIVNGDFTSFDKHSHFKSNKGNFDHFILGQLAKKYSVIYTFGNHDAFDWSDSQLFLDQMTLLKNSGASLVVENAVFHAEYKNLFSPYVDIPLSSNSQMRVIGYTLPNRKEKELEIFQYNKPKVIKKIHAINLKPPLKTAHNQANISTVALAFHLGAKRAKDFVSDLPSELTTKLNLVFAGHDHKQKIEKNDRSYLIDSGGYFNFSQILLDNHGQVLSTHFFDEPSQIELAGSVKKNSLEKALIHKTRKFLTVKKYKNGKIVFLPSRNIPKKQRNEPINTLNGRKKRKSHCYKVFKRKTVVNY